MSIPNPLIPQGSNLEQAARSKSTLSIAAFIVGAHAAVFLGLLLIGCNKERPSTEGTAAGSETTLTSTDTAVTPAGTIGDTNSITAATNAVDIYSQPVGFPGTPTNPPAPGLVGPATGQPPIHSDPSAGLSTQLPVETQATAGSEYTIKGGDIAYNIAKKNGISLKALKDANSGVDLGKLKVGQKISLPGSTAPHAAPLSHGGTPTEVADTSAVTAYTVKGGDTLTRIAKKHGTTSKAIRSANGLQSDVIKVGQKLKIPVKAPAHSEAVPAPVPAPVPTRDPAPGYNPPPYTPAVGTPGGR
jgi:LysM repeat protein